MVEIGLFPLELVLLPGEQLPLHVFEPRYRELIGECLEGRQEFGLVLSDESGMREVGTTAAVIEVLERFDDGRLNIVVEGRDRFRLLEETEGRSFRTARISPLGDDLEEPTLEETRRCLTAYRRLAEAAGTAAGEPESEADRLSYWIAAQVDFGAEIKQQLLELCSERELTVKLAELLDRARDAVRFARTARERAATNGRVEPP